jgi:hypothetical protein
MILARTGSNTWLFGISQMIGSVGMVLGGVIVGATGGFKRRINGVMLGYAAHFFLTGVVLGLGRANPAWMMAPWAVGIFFGFMVIPLINSSSRGITMVKIDPAVQGRVYSSMRLLSWGTIPVASLLGGTLADYVMEPAMREGGALAPIFGPLFGVGPGAGMSAILFFVGIIGTLFCLGMYFVPMVRDIETLLPDHQAASEPASPSIDTAEAEASPA